MKINSCQISSRGRSGSGLKRNKEQANDDFGLECEVDIPVVDNDQSESEYSEKKEEELKS